MGSPLTLHRVALLAALAALAGLLVAGVFLPVVGGAGLAARAVADDWQNLPSELKQPPLPQRSYILAADGSTLATFYYENRVTVSIDQVPTVMQTALLAIEDVRFYEHHGIDVKGSLRALFHNTGSGTVQQGGSTLTQQYVKNVLIESAQTKQAQQAARAQTLGRKLREARYALSLEQHLTKREILERYLNIAYFGSGAYGVGTAATHYFGVPVSKLTLAQSALLAGLVQNPTAYDPTLHPKAAKERRDTVLQQMVKYHFVDAATADAAIASPVTLHVTNLGNGCGGTSAPYFCDYVLSDFLGDPSYGATVSDRNKLLLRGGLTIRTTLDPTVQRAADAAIAKYVKPNEPGGFAGAEAVVEPGTGRIKAIAVSRPFGYDVKQGENSVNYAVDADHGGSTGFPAGSTFKVFVLAAALKQGIPLGTRIYAPSHIADITGFRTCDGPTVDYHEGVGNADPAEAGTYNLMTGTWQSVNTFYVQLENRTGVCDPVRLAEAMGVKPANPATPGYPHIPQYASFVLGGAAEFSPLDVADAYATLAAGGRHCAPVAITKVTDRSGRSFSVAPAQCEQVLDPALAATVTSVLQGVFDKPRATAYGDGLPDRPAAGKTGTVDNYEAAWFAGYIPQLAAAVWVGHPTDRVHHPLSDVTLGGTFYPRVFGATVPAPIWHDTMVAASAGLPVVDFPQPDQAYVNGRPVTVPDVAGLSVATATSVLQQSGLSVTVAPGTVGSYVAAGAVASTDPGAGAAVAPGSTVTIHVSSGQPPPPQAQPTPSPSNTGVPQGTASASPSGSPSATATSGTGG